MKYMFINAALPGTVLIILLLEGCAPSSPQQLWAPSMPDSIMNSSPAIKADLLEQAIHEYANRARQENGQQELDWSEEISIIARSHSHDMAANAFFSHINKQGEGATERAKRLGFSTIRRDKQYAVIGIGENIFATHRYKQYIINRDSVQQDVYDVDWKDMDTIAREAVDAWLQSTPHRRNLLSAIYTHQGIGVCIGSNGTIFVTQNLN